MSANLPSHLNFIGGEFVPSFDGKWLQKLDPRDSTDQARLADSDLMDVVRSVQTANKALTEWVKSTPSQRAERLDQIAELIESKAANFAAALFADLGTPLELSLKYSVPEAAAHFRAHAQALNQTTEAMTSSSRPVGLVGLITPASDPLACLASRVAPALAAGNAVIAKVSRYTPATGCLFAQVTLEAGLTPGLFSLLQGRGDAVGESLVRHPALSTLSFMGSTEKGRVVAQAAAESFKKMHFSLGAKNPILVFANTDLEDMIPHVARLCLGLHPSQALKGSRLFIQDSIFKSALELLKKEFDRPQVPFAPLPKPEQAQTYRDAVQLALKENGKVVTTGSTQPLTGNFVQPYLFADLTNCSTLQQDEIAGPLVLASSFKYQHEALKYANVSPYGRVGYIFEKDPEKALRVAQKFELGSVFINTSEPAWNPLEEIPLLKNSGSASEGGSALGKFFTRSTRIFL